MLIVGINPSGREGEGSTADGATVHPLLLSSHGCSIEELKYIIAGCI